MNRRQFLGAAASAGFSLGGNTAGTQGELARRPNIILILADDLGYGDLGCYGQRQIQTPNLDRMAAEGVRFTQAYAGATVCAPSRCCLHSGLHTGHALIRGNGKDVALRAVDPTPAEVLRKAGYRTGLVGKWSLGGLGTSGYPTRKGYDEWFGYFSQSHAHNYYPELLLDGEREVLLRGNTGTSKKDYSHDLFADRALKFIEKHRAEPFFLDLALTIPHTNNELGRDTGNGQEVPDDAPYSARNWPQPEKNFAAMITRMDSSVGKILELLRKFGIAGNTLVIFTSDNGPHKEGGHSPNFFESSGPLRGIKRDLYEGGIRVPAIAWWQGRIKHGQVSDAPWAFWDFLPSAAELAGTSAPAGLDGVSVVSQWLGGSQAKRPYFYWEHNEGKNFLQAIRVENLKAVRPGVGKPLELYNLSIDPGERRNLAADQPAKVEELKTLLAGARTDSPDFPVPRA